jgi:hypothetical protein
MTGYPKIWTSLLYADWFVQLPLQAKGLYLWLILEAKNQTDTGIIVFTSMTELASRVGTNRMSAARILAKFVQIGKISLKREHNGPVVIEVNNYRKYQQLRLLNLNPETPVSRVENRRLNQTRPEYKEIMVDGFKRIQRLCPKCHRPSVAFVDGVCFVCKGLTPPPKEGGSISPN